MLRAIQGGVVHGHQRKRRRTAMPLLVVTIAFAISCATPPGPRGTWGIMASAGDVPAVFAATRWSAGTRLRAYRIGQLADSVEVTISSSVAAPNSPLFVPEGHNSTWSHSVGKPELVPVGGLWICLPVDWTVQASAPDAAQLRRGAESGSISTALTQEGVEVLMSVASAREKLYFYLGYDLSSDPDK